MRITAIGASQDISVSGTSAAISTAAPQGVNRVRIVSTTAAYVTIGRTSSGTAPTADKASTGNSFRIAPNFPETFPITRGDFVAAIQDAASGTLTATFVMGD